VRLASALTTRLRLFGSGRLDARGKVSCKVARGVALKSRSALGDFSYAGVRWHCRESRTAADRRQATVASEGAYWDRCTAAGGRRVAYYWTAGQ
jgi:hypothetical protein